MQVKKATSLLNSTVLRYGAACLTVSMALLMTLLLWPIKEQGLFLPFIAAVMLSSWCGGRGPGLLATFLTLLVCGYFFLPPPNSLAVVDLTTALRVLEFIVVSLLITLLNASRHAALYQAKVAQAEAEESNNTKDEFLAMVSHELRTPLTSILGWARLLRSEQFDKKDTIRALSSIERNAEAQKQLIEDLLDVSRIIKGKLRLELRPVELTSIFEAAIDSARPAAEAKAITIVSPVDLGIVRVSGDPNRLEQIIWNLLSNAIKFTPKGGRVEVRLERIESFAQITVSDTGQGISAEFLPFVFDRFQQDSNVRTRTHGGLGLGLSIVRQLVEMHGGTVHAESQGEGQGATLTITLPLISHQEANMYHPAGSERTHPLIEGGVPPHTTSRFESTKAVSLGIPYLNQKL